MELDVEWRDGCWVLMDELDYRVLTHGGAALIDTEFSTSQPTYHQMTHGLLGAGAQDLLLDIFGLLPPKSLCQVSCCSTVWRCCTAQPSTSEHVVPAGIDWLVVLSGVSDSHLV